jgi:protein tyrosine/serine phosphatase
MRNAFLIGFLGLWVVGQAFITEANADIPRFAQVSPGIYRGAQPEEQADYDRLKAVGVKTILNLRFFSWDIADEQQLAKEMGFAFFSVPTQASPIPPSVGTINRALEILANPSLRPVFIHCAHGRDRTGLVVALYRIYYEGWKSADAYAEWQSFGYEESFLMAGLEQYFREHDDPSRRWIENGFLSFATAPEP